MFKESRKGNDSDALLLYDKKRLQSRFISSMARPNSPDMPPKQLSVS